jgi:predicted site-specific integrase-resolvase
MLSTAQAAALLGLRPSTLAAWREDGSQPGLAFFKLGKAVRYRYADIVAFIETRKASSTLLARRLSSSLRPISRQLAASSSQTLPEAVKPGPRVSKSAGTQTHTRSKQSGRSLKV